ncbi:MAG: AIR synthase-related protein [Opitutales bacterium]|nr:AIR synthase-related protein [Opitutales bacterium]NRA26532.1 phosphoribosylformylglycinamidine cyclo-ligase [Opitutales bacterium]
MPVSTSSRYSSRGVSATKEEVHAVVDSMDRGLVPGAFCKVTADYLTGSPEKANIIHADGSGTKSILAYLHYRETGDPSAFAGIAQDSIVMNLDDLICAGAVDNILFSSTVNRNARNFPGEALAALIEGNEAFLQKMRDLGVGIHSGGGETADVGDLTGTVTVDSCAVCILDRDKVVDNDEIRPGLAIVGLASGGQASYEDSENSGIGSNGLTSARHDLLNGYYRETYPETWDPNTDSEFVYCGPHSLNDPLPDSTQTVGQALLSPTRTYAPVVKQLLAELRPSVKGLVHCSGGGQTKCIRFGSQVHFVKDNLFSTPPLFKTIQAASGTSWKEMYQVYNMGHRLEIYCLPDATDAVIAAAQSFDIAAQVVGYTEASAREDRANHVTVKDGGSVHTYA